MKVNHLKYLITLALGIALGFGSTGCDEDKTAAAMPQANTIVDVAARAGNFNTLAGALQATGLDQTLRGPGPFTVFAPTDAAFALLPPGVLASLDAATLSTILKYHVYAGAAPASAVVGLKAAGTVQGEEVGIVVRDGMVYLNGVARVVTTDIEAENGIIHVIDAVLLPPSIAFPGSIVDALKAAPNFSTLVGAVVSADLATTLGSTSGPAFTVFAPTNDAFAALGLDLATLDKATLTSVLLYHVANGEVPAKTVVELSAAPTLEGRSVTIDVSGGEVRLNKSARVIRTDLRTANGIIHVIDAVLTP